MQRPFFLEQIHLQFNVHRIVALLGPRQCGKTTLAKQYSTETQNFPPENYFDLENPTDLERLASPKLAFEPLAGLIIIDEIQRAPNLFPILRYMHDEYPNKRFLILGSASKDLIQQSSETLAGRIGYIEITPFLAVELLYETEKLLLRGGFPRSFLPINDEESYIWRREYIRTYLEQDIPALGIQIHTGNIRRFWTMLAHYHGQMFNGAELANSLGLSRPTIKHYLDLLAGTFMVRVLQPWYANIKKRQVKTPKIYFRDSGIYHYFLNVANLSSLLVSPKLGASWEGFALEQVIQAQKLESNDCYFWSTHNNAELDLLVIRGNKKLGFEFKYHDAPKLTPSMRIAMHDLQLDSLIIIYPGNISYSLTSEIQVVGLQEYIRSI